MEFSPVVHSASDSGRADHVDRMAGPGWRWRANPENASCRPRLQATWATREAARRSTLYCGWSDIAVDALDITALCMAMWPVLIVSIGVWALLCGRELENGQFTVRGLLLLTTIAALDAAFLGILVRLLPR